MKKKFRSIDFRFLTARSFFYAHEYVALVKEQLDAIPHYHPVTWSIDDDRCFIFNPDDIEAIFRNIRQTCPPTAIGYSRYWKRNETYSAEGVWCTRLPLFPLDGSNDHHAYLDIKIFSQHYYVELLRFLKKCSIFDPVIGYVDAVTEKYYPIGMKNEFLFSGLMILSSHVLRHWLPDMPWAVLFGPCYVKHFGLKKLLSVPAHVVEKLGDSVFVQLTPDIDDLWENFAYVMDCREQAKCHLGYDSFWQRSLHYDWREEPKKAGKVFRVPELPFLD